MTIIATEHRRTVQVAHGSGGCLLTVTADTAEARTLLTVAERRRLAATLLEGIGWQADGINRSEGGAAVSSHGYMVHERCIMRPDRPHECTRREHWELHGRVDR